MQEMSHKFIARFPLLLKLDISMLFLNQCGYTTFNLSPYFIQIPFTFLHVLFTFQSTNLGDHIALSSQVSLGFSWL